MPDIMLTGIASATGCSIVCGDESIRPARVIIDSRNVHAGDMLVCFPGERVDGNDFAVSAMRAGAAAVVMTREPDEDAIATASRTGCAILRAADDDATTFLLRLAASWRRANPHWFVVGVTGSVGKTTTKEMVAAALSAGMRVHVTEGNHNNLVGVPLTILSASASDDAVVVEMGMDHAGELATLTDVVRPSVALITNIGTSHIGNLGSQEAVARAKAEIAEGVGFVDGQEHSFEPCLLITDDNPFAGIIEHDYCERYGVPLVKVGRPGHVVWAEGVTVGNDGYPLLTVAFEGGEELPTKMCVPSTHVVSNLLLAMEVAERAGVELGRAIRATESLERTGMRLDVIRKDGMPTVIDDSYNASPTSMAAGLDALCTMPCEGRRIAVLGEIGELGDDSRHLHGCVGAYAAAKPIDVLVLVGGEMADAMADDARMMGFPSSAIMRVEDTEEACERVVPMLEASDLVLVKASRFVGLDALSKRIVG